MIYLDHSATSWPKPPQVVRAVGWALEHCANPGRGGYEQVRRADRVVYQCRVRAGKLFGCSPDRVVFTGSCTQGLNMALHSLFAPGDPVVISGFEHNGVTRPLYGMGAKVHIAGRRLFDPADTLDAFEKALREGVKGAVFTCCSNVFGYVLPYREIGALCRAYGVPFVVDGAQGAGVLPLDDLDADFLAVPGHKGLLGPQGTGMLICKGELKPWLRGGTGSNSQSLEMPDFLPDAGEAGTLNVSGIAGLSAGMGWLEKDKGLVSREKECLHQCISGLQELGLQVFTGEGQMSCVSFVPPVDCQELADRLGRQGVALRAGLHCAPLAHESAGTLDTGTVRVSVGRTTTRENIREFMKKLRISLKSS